MLSICQIRENLYQQIVVRWRLIVVESDKSRGSKSSEIEAEVERGATRCDACGSPMKPMGHCKYWCLKCGFLRTCNDVI